jgi:hypothetical protein
MKHVAKRESHGRVLWVEFEDYILRGGESRKRQEQS